MPSPDLNQGGGPVGVFFSYAHEDATARTELHGHLASLERGNIIRRWSDRQIGPGSAWRGEVDSHLYRAQIFVALVSPDFMESGWCQRELSIANIPKKNPRDNVVVLPVLVRDVSLVGSDLNETQLLPPDRVPIERWEPKDRGWRFVADAVANIAAQIAARRAQMIPEADNLKPRDRGFWDRKDVLEEIWIGFNDRKSRLRILTGREGIGKEWVAREFAWEHRPDYKLIWWIDANDPVAAKEQMAALADKRQLEADTLDRRIVRLHEWLADESSGPWLLVFANATSPDLLTPLLPEPIPRHGSVLVTTSGSGWDPYSPTVLPGFGLDDGIDFLLARSGDSDETAARELTTLLGGWPQALEAAVQYVKAGQGDLVDYIERLKAANDGGSAT